MVGGDNDKMIQRYTTGYTMVFLNCEKIQVKCSLDAYYKIKKK